MQLKILSQNRIIEFEAGKSILDIMHSAGLAIESPCGGRGICGRCRISEGGKVHLACRTFPTSNLSIELVDNFKDSNVQVEDSLLSNQTEIISAVVINENDSSLDYFQGGSFKKIASLDELFEPLGLAIDLGTTTIVVSLISLLTGKLLATASQLNPQTKYGHDVMSRIEKASTDEGLKLLRDLAVDSINGLIKNVTDEAVVSAENIVDVVVGGNTTMVELLANLRLDRLGKAPFNVGLSAGVYPATEFGLNIAPFGKLYLAPIFQAFVGTDISCGFVAIQAEINQGQTLLFIDIGTNGEMAIFKENKIVVTSTAAGPAFEGMGLSCGTRAVGGAIESVSVNNGEISFGVIGELTPHGICGSGVIDTVAVLVKLGLMDKNGLILENGLQSRDLDLTTSSLTAELASLKHPRSLESVSSSSFSEPQPGKEFSDRGEGGNSARQLVNYDDYIVAGEYTNDFKLAEGVVMTQGDIREIQMAKSAIRSGIDLLLERTGVEKPDKVIIAGGFGKHLNPENLEIIGLIPPGFGELIDFVGNSSLNGAYNLLINREQRTWIEELAKNVEHLSLADDADFMEKYMANMGFFNPPRHG